MFHFFSHEIISHNLITTISDYLPQFLFVPNILSNLTSQKSNFYERDSTKFEQKDFLLDYFDKDWPDIL